MRLFSIYRILLIAFALGFIGIKIPQAQVVVTEDQQLGFGTFSFVNYNAALNINIENDGSYTANGNTVVISPPSLGEYSMTSSQFNAVYTVVPPATVTLSGPDGDFTVDNFRVLPSSLVTDGAGSDNFSIAARISTAGDGSSYDNGAYSTTFDITISF